MASVNKVIIVGNLGRDPEIRHTQAGNAVANFSVATTESWKDKASGERKEQTEWHRLVAFGRLAEVIGKYLGKGSQIYVEGKLQTRKWTDNSNAERRSTEIVVRVMEMLGKANERRSEGARGGGGYQQDPPPKTGNDDIPF